MAGSGCQASKATRLRTMARATPNQWKDIMDIRSGVRLPVPQDRAECFLRASVPPCQRKSGPGFAKLVTMVTFCRRWVALYVLAALPLAAQAADYSFDQAQTFLKTYCQSCHQGTAPAGKFN